MACATESLSIVCLREHLPAASSGYCRGPGTFRARQSASLGHAVRMARTTYPSDKKVSTTSTTPPRALLMVIDIRIRPSGAPHAHQSTGQTDLPMTESLLSHSFHRKHAVSTTKKESCDGYLQHICKRERKKKSGSQLARDVHKSSAADRDCCQTRCSTATQTARQADCSPWHVVVGSLLGLHGPRLPHSARAKQMPCARPSPEGAQRAERRGTSVCGSINGEHKGSLSQFLADLERVNNSHHL